MFGNKLGSIEKLAEKGKAEELEKLTTDKKAEVRYAAIEALGKCSGDVPYNALVPLLRAADSEERAKAALALAKLGRVSARVHIEHQIAQEKDAKVLTALNDALKILHGKED